MSGTGRCYDNAQMECFFAALKKKLYQLQTGKLPIAQVRSIVFSYMTYYNQARIYTANPGGRAPAMSQHRA